MKLSVLDLAPVTEETDVGASLRNSVDLAQHSEKLGYHRGPTVLPDCGHTSSSFEFRVASDSVCLARKRSPMTRVAAPHTRCDIIIIRLRAAG